MKNVLLIFDDPRELDFIGFSLSENGFKVYKTQTLKEGLIKANEIIPELIVVNTSDTSKDVFQFSNHLKTDKLKDVLFLCMIELEDYLDSPTKKHFVIKPVRPKLLLSLIRGVLNNEEITWALTLQ